MIPSSNCVPTIIEDMSGDPQGSVPILMSLLHAAQAHRIGARVGDDKARPHAASVAMNCLAACQTLWPVRSLYNRACLRYDGKATASTREC
ncbi:uncharacterized protein TNCV_2578591 [Trichonephila clavipes]|nr:uncharacterized protein TNCV_2578591 [Trichonephila clavipes]